MMALAAEDIADFRRWVVCGAVIVLAHGGIAAGIASWRETAATAEPAAAIVIEFAPLPVGPATPAPQVAPGPEQAMSDASPNHPSREEKAEDQIDRKTAAKVDRIVDEIEMTPVEEPLPDLDRAPNPELALVLPPPSQQQVEQESSQPQQPRAPAPTTTAPQVAPEQAAALPAAPEQGPITPKNSPAVQAWQTRVVTLLERNKRYPPVAQSRRQQGVAQLFFSLDRQGRVVESRVLRSSGVAVLDGEALALVRRAQPFPPPPPGLTGDRVGVTVPIRFNLK